MTRYYGKYRGVVVNNIDPMQLGRVQIMCPAVLGESPLSWAMPCVPFAGMLEGFFAIPTIGAPIWVEFEGGDPSLPIWTGGFWTTGTVPVIGGLPFVRTFKTLGCQLTLDDTPGAGGITLQVLPPVVGVPATITLGVTGIEISCGAASITLDPVKVTVNRGALEVI